VRQPVPATPEQVSALVAAACADWRVVRTWPLSGGVSAQVTGIEVEEPGGRRRRLVLHQYGAANLHSDPRAASTEYRLLELLWERGLPVPRPWFADEDGSIGPGPSLLQDLIDGERVDDPPDLVDFTGQLAATLAGLHDAGIARADVPSLADACDDVPRRLGTRPSVPSHFRSANAVRAALAENWPPPQVNRPVALHGDYWPGNVLWRDGRLVGVIDWEDALFGDPLADLAVTRIEIAWAHGAAAMRTLTNQYLALRPAVDVSTMPLWDLHAALRAATFDIDSWDLPADRRAAAKTAFEEFAGGALRGLAGPAPAGEERA
jgi:aminoglycoside phosphotransferase (APT) family kinase protein